MGHRQDVRGIFKENAARGSGPSEAIPPDPKACSVLYHRPGRQGYDSGLALFTDLYELTMLQAYFEEGLGEEAAFSLFVRRLPDRRNYLIACGLDTVLDHLERLRFHEEDLTYLASLGKFSPRFLEWLRGFRFTGDVYAVPEGTPVFAMEPLLEVVGPLLHTQLVETLIMNQMHVQTLHATKARRVVTAAGAVPVVDFGARRMHGIDAALKAARAFYISGVTASSNVLAGREFGVPVAGTMAHSYIQVHRDEAEAFQAFARLYPGSVLLVDTYDTLGAVQKVIDLIRESKGAFRVKALRIDSGDLLALSRESRRLLDEAGLGEIQIFLSGGLDEDQIQKLLQSGAPVDGFGVGTSMAVSNDAPDLDMVYKLAEYGGRGRFKLSSGKATLPGRKQIFRMSEHDQDVKDVIAMAGEDLPGRPLLQQVMREGKRLPVACVDLETCRAYAEAQFRRLPDHVRSLSPADPPYPVEVSPALARHLKRLVAQIDPSGGDPGGPAPRHRIDARGVTPNGIESRYPHT